MNQPIIHLQKGREQSLLRKHPWIFSGGIKKIEGKASDGDVVTVIDFKGEFLARGHYSTGSIAVRILTFDDIAIDQAFWANTIAHAYDYRLQHLGFDQNNTNTYRLIHGEGDGVPGLIVDVYKNVAVLQSHSQGMYEVIDEISQAILNNTGNTVQHIFTKNQESLKGRESADEWLTEPTPMPIQVIENGHEFEVNVETGQKTGFFLDQRDNRALVGSLSKGKSVLNLFCYTGGFSVYALNNEATKVVSIDVSKTAMDAVDINVARTPNPEKHTSLCTNIMEYLKDDMPDDIYDIVIVDPPAFAKSVNKRHNAIQAYKRLNAMSMKKVKKGGLMLTFSCSQVVTTQLFYDTIVAAGIESGREIKVMKHLSQGADHPVNLYHPEGHYLKGLLVAIY